MALDFREPNTMDFEWNETKARTNQRKHGVSFLEAAEVFSDEHSSCVQDPDHSYDEDRYLLFGVSLIKVNSADSVSSAM